MIKANVSVLAAALLCCPSVIHAEQVWGDQGGCARVAGNTPPSDSVFILWPDRIERWESECKIVEIEGDMDIRAIIHTECSGEGETWRDSYGVTPTGDDLISIWPIDDVEFITELRQCK